MSRARPMATVFIAIVAAIALSAEFASSASAGWFINGQALGAGKSAAIASLASVDGSLLLSTKVGETLIKVACMGPIHISKGRIAEPDLMFEQAIVFLNCNTAPPTPTKCKLSTANETITTSPLLALAIFGPKAPGARLVFKPETGKSFTEISFAEGTACIFEGSQPVKGAVTMNVPSGRAESISQAVAGLGSVENNSLEIGSGNKAFIEGGSELFLLATHSKWSFGGEFLTAEPSPLDFGNVAKETSVTKTVTFTNLGSEVTIENSMILSGEPFFKVVKDGCKGKTLASLGKCSVEVSFRPTEVEAYTGELLVLSSPLSSVGKVQLKGSGV